MKKKSIIVLNFTIISIVMVLIIILCSCDKTLTAPKNLSINDAEILSWDKVEGASKYEVSVNSKSFYTENNEIDLFNEFDDTCEYIIDVRALNDKKTSSYSEQITYKIQQNDLLEMIKLESVRNSHYIVGINNKIKGKLFLPSKINGKNYNIKLNCFKDCKELTAVIIEGENSNIGSSAFFGCDNLRFVKMNSINSINPRAFYNCSKLEKVYFSNDLKVIDQEAFAYCTSLKEINLPSSLYNIDGDSFLGCEALENISIENNDKFEVINNCIINKEEGSVVLGCNFSTIPTDPKITKICGYAFQKMNFEKIVIPENIVEIKAFAFSNNQNLKEIVLHGKITLIDQGVFSKCLNLKKITIPKTIKKMFGFQFSITPINVFEDTLITDDTIKSNLCNEIMCYDYAFYEKKLSENEKVISGYVYGCEFEKDSENANYYVTSIQKPSRIDKNIIIPQREGYKFLGWSTTTNKEDIVTTTDTIEACYIAVMLTPAVKETLKDEKGNPINIQVTNFDLSKDYSNIERFYAIWEKE